MNKRAYEVITAQKLNAAQMWVDAIARLCLQIHVREKRPTQYQVLIVVINHLATCPISTLARLVERPREAGQFVNDVRDVWEAYANDPSLL